MLKLYAGDLKSKADIVEVLKRNPNTDINAIKRLCDKYRVRGLKEILKEIPH